jgi:hypothetical protein
VGTNVKKEMELFLCAARGRRSESEQIHHGQDDAEEQRNAEDNEDREPEAHLRLGRHIAEPHDALDVSLQHSRRSPGSRACSN